MLTQCEMQFQNRVKDTILYYLGVVNGNKKPLANPQLGPFTGYLKKTLSSMYIDNLIPATIKQVVSFTISSLNMFYTKEKSYLLFLNVPDLVFEADKPIIYVSLICLGRRGCRVQRRLQGAGGRLALPSRVHLLLGRLHALVLALL